MLLVERDDDGTYIVSEDTTHVYGTGATQFEAICDYAANLVVWCELQKKDMAERDR